MSARRLIFGIGLLAATVALGEPGTERRVGLEELAPTPQSPNPSTARVRRRAPPEGGFRQRVGDVAVPSACGERGCLDGLVDLRSKRDLIPPHPTRDERELLGAPGGTVERIVKIAHVSERWVSAYLGGSDTSGGAHAGNHLSCVTFDRLRGRQVGLRDVVPAARAQRLLSWARGRLAEVAAVEGQYTLDERSFLLDDAGRFSLCALAPSTHGGTVIEIREPPR